MSGENLTEGLLVRVPELRAALEAGIEDWRDATGEEPSHDYVYGALLVPQVVRVADQLPSDHAETTLTRVFDHIEELLASSDEAVRDVADVSFAEQLASSPETVKKAARLMGPLLLSAVLL